MPTLQILDRPTTISTTLKLAKLILKATYLFTNWIASIGLTAACAVNSSLPFNTMWIADYVIENLDFNVTYTFILRKGVLSIFNYIIWKATAIQGYWMVAELLIGILSLTNSHDMANR